MNDNEINAIYRIGGYGKNAPKKDIAHWKSSSLSKLVQAVERSSWNKDTRSKADKYDDVVKASTAKDKIIASQAKEIETLKATQGTTDKWTTFKALIRELFNFKGE